MSILNPIALWGLLALAIPLLIHFLSKKQQNVIHFGSNRFLESTETSSARSIQLSDLLLLILRALLLATIVLLVSKLSSKETKKNKQIFIEKQIVESKDYTSILSDNSISNLTVNYFTYDRSRSNEDVKYFPSSYTLIHHLNGIHDSIIVYSHSLAQNFKGSAVGLIQDIDWRTVPLMEQSDDKSSNIDPLTLDIICAKNSKNSLEDFQQVLTSLKQHLLFDISYQKNAEWKVYIDTIITDFNDNLYQINWMTSHPSFSFEKNIDAYSMKGSMSKKAFLESNFPIELAQALISSRAEQNASKNEIYQPVYQDVLADPKTANAEISIAWKSYSPHLWLLGFLLLLIERIYSLRKETT